MWSRGNATSRRSVLCDAPPAWVKFERIRSMSKLRARGPLWREAPPRSQVTIFYLNVYPYMTRSKYSQGDYESIRDLKARELHGQYR